MKHLTQSDAWARFRLATPNVKKILKIGSCQIFIHKIPFVPFTVAYLPRPEKIENLEEIKEACQKEWAIFLKIEPTTKLDQLDKFAQSRSILPQHTIYIDLIKPEKDLLEEMHEKTRYNIRLAEKKGVMVKQNNDIETFIKLLTETEDRQNFYSHNPNYYRKLFAILKPIILMAYYKDIPIATIILFNHDGVLYYPYGGSDPKYKEYMAPSLLHWEAIKLGKKLGCKIYDMWGSYKNTPTESDPWWGIYRFKKGFGGNEITFPDSVDIPLSPLYSLYPLLEKFRNLTK